MFAEGKKTEPIYLTDWHRRHRDRVVVVISEFHGGPLQLVERAIEARRRDRREARKQQGRPYDEIWCVFDRDEHPNFDSAVKLAQDHEIRLAISNPCIELWFLLHFQDQTAHIERHYAKSRCKGLLRCSKTLTDDALQQLRDSYEDARERARGLARKHRLDGSPPRSNPSSDLWRLVDAIRDF